MPRYELSESYIARVPLLVQQRFFGLLANLARARG